MQTADTGRQTHQTRFDHPLSPFSGGILGIQEIETSGSTTHQDKANAHLSVITTKMRVNHKTITCDHKQSSTIEEIQATEDNCSKTMPRA